MITPEMAKDPIFDKPIQILDMGYEHGQYGKFFEIDSSDEQDTKPSLTNTYGSILLELEKNNSRMFKQVKMPPLIKYPYGIQRDVVLDYLEYLENSITALGKKSKHVKQLEKRIVALENQINVIQSEKLKDYTTITNNASKFKTNDQAWLNYLFEQSAMARKQLEIDCAIDTDEIMNTEEMNGYLSKYVDEGESAVDLVRTIRDES